MTKHQDDSGPHFYSTDDDGVSSVAAVLAGARHARSDPAAAERAVLKALELAPDDMEALLGAYRFYFYDHRWAAALPLAADILVHMARRLNIPTDWCVVKPDDAAFTAAEEAPSLYLQALVAWGYCNVRLGRIDEGCLALTKAAELDPRDRFGAAEVLSVIAASDDEDDDDD